jgi:hypothetical protein
MIAGAILAAAVAFLVALGDSFELDASRFALLGVAAGAVLGLVPSRSAAERAGAWALGFGGAWLGYFGQAALLPDTAIGRAVAAALVVLVVAGVTALSLGLLPFWAGLLGIAAAAAGHEIAAADAEGALATDSFAVATAVALATSVGFLVTSLMVRTVPATAAPPPEPGEASVPGPRHAETDAGMGILDWSRSKA